MSGLDLPGTRPPAAGVAVLSGGAGWEPALLPLLTEPGSGLHLVRRCVDVAELLAVCAAGAVRVAVVDAAAARVDRDTVDRLRRLGVSTLLVVGAASDAGSDGLGAADTVVASQQPAAVLARARVLARRTTVERAAEAARLPATPAPCAASGRLIAVWGAGGAPGRSTLAVNLATELARLDRSVLLVDADAAGGAVATMLGLVDEAPGVAAACRSALRGRLDPPVLAGLAVALDDRLRVLTGASRPDRWRELRPSALEVIWECAAALADDVVVDLAPGLTGDEPDPLEPALSGPSAATRCALEAADVVLAVTSADTLGLLRAVHGLDLLAEQLSAVTPQVVVNRVRSSVAGTSPRHQVRAALRQVGAPEPVAYLPEDPRAADAALRAGRALADAAPRSALRRAIAGLAADLTPEPAGSPADTSADSPADSPADTSSDTSADTAGARGRHGMARRRRSRRGASLRSGT